MKNAVWPGWETVRVLGHGSFGAVYEIQRDVLGEIEKAALKVISIPQNQSEVEELYGEGYDEESVINTFKSHLKNIVNEYSLMRKMNGCSNVVHCDDVRYVPKENGIGWDIYIKMELLTPLMNALPLEVPEATVIRVGKDMCRALQICSMHDVIHRDIKPQNMFYSANGDFKLGDFGIAKTVERTMGGTKIGTFKYMAPEVYNNQPYGAAVDIYSLGLVLYWMLNMHRMPFMPLPPAKMIAGMDGQAAQRRLMGEPFPPPVNGSAALKRIVMKACAYNTKDRYENATQMLRDLEALDHQIPVQKPPVTPPAKPPVEKPPVTPPLTPPVEKPPATPPLTPPVEKPPATPPVTPPVHKPPVTPPVTPVEKPPVTPPVTPPVHKPPVTPPLTPPVEKPPVTPPVTPPVHKPPATPPKNPTDPRKQRDLDTTERVRQKPEKTPIQTIPATPAPETAEPKKTPKPKKKKKLTGLLIIAILGILIAVGLIAMEVVYLLGQGNQSETEGDEESKQAAAVMVVHDWDPI